MTSNASESIVLGAIIEAGAQNLPPHLERFIQHAPESCACPRNAAVAVATQQLRRDGKPVHAVSVAQAIKIDDAFTFVSQLLTSAIDLATAELEAIQLWKAFQQRQRCQTLAEAAQQAQQHPEQAAAIAANTIQTLAAIATDATGIESQIEARTFNASRVVDPPEARFTLAGTPVSTPGNITSVCAVVKAGKSSFVAAAMASVVTHSKMADCLGWRSSNKTGGAVIHIDTEQSEYDHHALVQQALRRADATLPTWLRSSFITGFSVRQCRETIRHSLKAESDRCGSIHSLILDGVADFVADVNDAAECNDFVAELHALAIKYHCSILGVIHLNPGSEKTRGHLGSQFERKAETNLRLDTDGEATVVWSEKNRRAPITKANGPRFAWSSESQMHVSIAGLGDSKAEARKGELVEIRDEAFRIVPKDAMHWGELVTAIKSVPGVHSARSAERIVTELKKAQLIHKNLLSQYAKAA